jgi:hypothetical protein
MENLPLSLIQRKLLDSTIPLQDECYTKGLQTRSRTFHISPLKHSGYCMYRQV